MRRILVAFLAALAVAFSGTAVTAAPSQAAGDPRPIACGYLAWNGSARSVAYSYNSARWPNGWTWFASGNPPGFMTNSTGFLSNGSGWCRGSWYAYTDGRWYPFYAAQRCQFYAIADAQLDITFSKFEGCYNV